MLNRHQCPLLERRQLRRLLAQLRVRRLRVRRLPRLPVRQLVALQRAWLRVEPPAVGRGLVHRSVNLRRPVAERLTSRWRAAQKGWSPG